MVTLLSLPEGKEYSLTGVSGDGTVVLSFSSIFSEKNGWVPRSIEEILESNNFDLSGIIQFLPNAISADGTTIVGQIAFASAREAFRLQILNMFGQHRMHQGIAETGDWMGRVHAMHDPWVWCEDAPCWQYFPEVTANAEGGWVYVPDPGELQIVPISSTDWGYSLALEKWLYLTDSGWVYMM